MAPLKIDEGLSRYRALLFRSQLCPLGQEMIPSTFYRPTQEKHVMLTLSIYIYRVHTEC